jgi:DNA polymerase-3 subunit beta
MNILVTKLELSKALQLVQSAVAKRTTMPILSNLLISAEGGLVKISASDLELSAVAQAKAEVKSGGSTTINAKVFGDIVRELPDGDIRLVLTEGERLEISAKGSKFKIIGASAEEYPTLPGLSCEAPDKLSAHLLLEMISKALYAVSHDETRFNLNGVCFEHLVDGASEERTAKGGKGKKKDSPGALLRMVATDGHRLALTTRPVASLSFEGRVIVPRKALSEIRRVLELEGEKDVGIGIVDGFFILETSDFKMASRLIEAQYPDYSQVLPQQKGLLVTLNCGDLVSALRRVMLMVTDREKGVRLTFSSGSLRISSSSPELGEATEEFPLKYEGEVLNIGFNAGYLLEVASTLSESEGLAIELHGEVGPGKFYAEQDEASLAIVMPMRL